MGKNTLVINCDIGETRVALIENGILSELHVERRQQKGIVGNIYLGKVSRVLPGMQAAFIDIGEERAAFLHVEDLIRPADFEAYLAGSKRREHEPLAKARAGSPGEEHELIELPDDAASDELTIDVELEPDDGTIEGSGAGALGDDELVAGSEPPEASLLTAAGVEGARSTLDLIETAPIEEPDAPVLRKSTRAPAELTPPVHEPDTGELREGEVVRKVVPNDSIDMAARRGRRRRGGRGGANRSEIDADAKADEPPGEAGEGASVEGAPKEGAEGAAAPAKSEAPAPRAPREAASASATPSVPVAAERRSSDPQAQASRSETIIRTEPLTRDPARSREGGRGDRDRHGRSRGGERGKSGGGERGRSGASGGGGGGGSGSGGGGGSSGGSGGDRGRREPREGGLRLGRSTPINEVVREGQEVIVQVTKDPLGTKGARVSSHVSLPGRYVVYMPTVEHVGVSRRIGSDVERRRLREAIEAMKPPQGGLIVRTLAEGLTKKQLKADVGYLVRLWGEIAKKKEEGRKAPYMLFQELDVVLRTARDMFTDDIEKIVIDDKEQFHRLQRFIEMFMPERVGAIELYTGDEPIFDAYGLEDEIARALSRKVPLGSGGYLIIDQAEALTAIDVNSGRFVGKGNKDPEDTILVTNMEAVAEIAYQLRFRNIGGLIVLDLIDMERPSNREKVYRALEQALLADKAKTSINRISELGLVEMTRKRTRESLGRTLHEPCFYCDGTGQLQSRNTVAFEILRQIRRERQSLAGYKVIVNAHPTVVDFLLSEERDTLKEAERRYQRQIMLVPHREYHLEQFDLAGS